MVPVDPIKQLIHQLSRLPGIGRKSATHLTYTLLGQNGSLPEQLAEAIIDARRSTIACSLCGNMTTQDPCRICSDPRRESKTICVVERIPDLLAIETTGEFRGRYHVLGGAISPLNGIGPDNLRLGELAERVAKEAVEELIIATNPTVDGEATALYIRKVIPDESLKITRIASGIPAGGDLEYLDRETIKQALHGRRPVE